MSEPAEVEKKTWQPPKEFEVQHIAFVLEDGMPRFIVKTPGEDRHWYLILKPAHCRLIANDTTHYVCTELQKIEGRQPID